MTEMTLILIVAACIPTIMIVFALAVRGDFRIMIRNSDERGDR